MKERFLKLWAIDPRSLAALRMGLAVIVLIDLAVRSADLVAHYTDQGVVARHFLSPRFIAPFHFISGEPFWQGCLFAGAAAAALCLLAGYQTVLATVVSWLLLASLHARNPMVINGGDELLRMLLFWGMFLPLGRVWSVDAWRRGAAAEQATPALSVATAALLVQICLMYVCTALFKFNDTWLQGLGLYYVFNYDAYARPLAKALLDYPGLLRWLSLGAVWSEAIGPLLVFVPFRTAWWRMLVIGVMWAFHIGIELTLTVGLFSYVCLVAWLVFLPPEVWNLLRFPRRARDEAPAGQPFEKLRVHWSAQAVCGLLLLYVVLWNVQTLRPAAGRYVMPSSLRDFGQRMMLAQKWNMFSTAPSQDGWFVASAWLANQTDVDLVSGELTTVEKPDWIYRRHPNHRWRKFYRNLSRRKNGHYHHERYGTPLCRYLARRWNATHSEEEQVMDVNLYLMLEATPAPGQPPASVAQVLWHKEWITASSPFEEAQQQWLGGSSDLPPGI